MKFHWSHQKKACEKSEFSSALRSDWMRVCVLFYVEQTRFSSYITFMFWVLNNFKPKIFLMKQNFKPPIKIENDSVGIITHGCFSKYYIHFVSKVNHRHRQICEVKQTSINEKIMVFWKMPPPFFPENDSVEYKTKSHHFNLIN